MSHDEHLHTILNETEKYILFSCVSGGAVGGLTQSTTQSLKSNTVYALYKSKGISINDSYLLYIISLN